MRKIVFFPVLLTMSAAVSAEAVRCGTDDFGNTVCADRNGETTIVPADWAAASGSTPADNAAARDAKQSIRPRMRCGIDPFGNKVCR